jgi:hypothetical protein
MVRGITRRDNPHETLFLEYEADTPMAEAKINSLLACILKPRGENQLWELKQGKEAGQAV